MATYRYGPTDPSSLAKLSLVTFRLNEADHIAGALPYKVIEMKCRRLRDTIVVTNYIVCSSNAESHQVFCYHCILADIAALLVTQGQVIDRNAVAK